MLATLLPESWFTGQHWLLLLAIAAVCMILIMRGADWLVASAAELATRLGMPQIVIGATIVSLGTTTPEMSVSVLAAWTGNSGLALGNAVGSIIADTGFIFGLGCIMAGTIPADKFILSRQGWVQAGVAVLLAATCYGMFFVEGTEAALPRWFGIFLLVLLAGYMCISVKWSREHQKSTTTPIPEELEESVPDASTKTMFGLLLMGFLGLLLVVLAGDALVQSVTDVAVQWHVPQTVIAATIVAMGTSLPELVVGLTAVRKGCPQLLVGNVIGADILNVLFVIGAAATAAALPVVENGNAIFLYLHLPAMLLILLLFRIFIFRAGRTGQFRGWMGWPLVGIYVAYIVLQYAF